MYWEKDQYTALPNPAMPVGWVHMDADFSLQDWCCSINWVVMCYTERTAPLCTLYSLQTKLSSYFSFYNIAWRTPTVHGLVVLDCTVQTFGKWQIPTHNQNIWAENCSYPVRTAIFWISTLAFMSSAGEVLKMAVGEDTKGFQQSRAIILLLKTSREITLH